jgi:uncharacterized protein
MIPTTEEIQKLHQKYASFAKAPDVHKLVYEHCQVVSEIALWCAENAHESVDKELLQAAALLHDIASYPFFDENGHSDGKGFYPLHGILGAKILLDEGFDPRIAQIVETHLLLGISEAEIRNSVGRAWALPTHDYTPQSVEAELLCYADRFHSKNPVFNAFEPFLDGLRQRMPDQAKKLEAMAERFGVPDITALAKKYSHPVR